MPTCTHVPDNRICGPCFLTDYPDFDGPVYDWREGDQAFHTVYEKTLTITKILGHGSLIMTQEGLTVGTAHLKPLYLKTVIACREAPYA